MTVYVIVEWFGHVSDGEGSCLGVFRSYDDALDFVKSMQDWHDDFCDPGNDVWGDEYRNVQIEEHEVE
jgi:hypothetical protein